MSSDDRETTEDGASELNSLNVGKPIDAGIVSGLHYAVGFLAGVAAAFADHGKADLARAFTAAATELGRVTPKTVKRDWPDGLDVSEEAAGNGE